MTPLAKAVVGAVVAYVALVFAVNIACEKKGYPVGRVERRRPLRVIGAE